MVLPRLLGRRTAGVGIDQHARIEQAMRIQGRLGRPEGSGKQWWALAIVPRPMVAPDRMMVSVACWTKLEITPPSFFKHPCYGTNYLADLRPEQRFRPLTFKRSVEALEDPCDECVKLRHKVTQELFCRFHGNFAAIADQTRGELNICLGRIHLRRITETKNAAQVLLCDSGTN
jgi:hypothetical protein